MKAIAKSAKIHPAAKKCCGWQEPAIYAQAAHHIQSVQKKRRIRFCLISQQPNIGFSNNFFLLKTEIHTLIQNYFFTIFGDRDIYKTKCGSETDQFIFILSHSGLKSSKFAPSPDSSQVAPSQK